MESRKQQLSALWEAHLRAEFETKDLDEVMATMVPEPMVNHIPTMTGGVGFQQVFHFYKNHFIPKIPADMHIRSVSRTAEGNMLVDEFVGAFTHDREIDFMLPGVAATGKYVELPHVVIVFFEGDKLSAEHIYWDQASLLAQIGLLDENQLPIVGVLQARKLIDKLLPANTLLKRLIG
jgi:carboxymethylenebutenolidase